jgi:hypothetical protein
VNGRIPITILEVRSQKEATNAGVVQDKETPRRSHTASEQPSNVQGVAFQHETDENPPALQRPKHHGSQKRRVVPVTGCVPPFIADQLEQMRDQGGKQKLSRSAVVANLIMRGVQQNVDMQYGATLEPVIEKSINRHIQSYSNRNANIRDYQDLSKNNLLIYKTILKANRRHAARSKLNSTKLRKLGCRSYRSPLISLCPDAWAAYTNPDNLY